MNKFICTCHNQEYKSKHSLLTHYSYERLKTNSEFVNRRRNLSLKHRQECPEYYTKYYQENKEVARIRQNRQVEERQKDPIKKNIKRVHDAKYYIKNRERELENAHKRYLTPQGKANVIANYHKRRVILETGQHSKLTAKLVQEIYEANIFKYGTLTCDLCFKPILFGEDTLEHFIPVSRIDEFPEVDLNGRENLGVAHSTCNHSKYDKTLKEWFQLYPELIS